MQIYQIVWRSTPRIVAIDVTGEDERSYWHDSCQDTSYNSRTYKGHAHLTLESAVDEWTRCVEADIRTAEQAVAKKRRELAAGILYGDMVLR